MITPGVGEERGIARHAGSLAAEAYLTLWSIYQGSRAGVSIVIYIACRRQLTSVPISSTLESLTS